METVKYRSNGVMRTPKSLTQDVGVSSSWMYGRFSTIQDDFLDDWKDTQAKVKSVNRMLKNSPLIGGALRLAVEMSIRKVDWFFTSKLGDEDPDLELVRDAWDNIDDSWHDHISDAVLSAFYGWSAFTNCYQRQDGRLLWKRFKYLHPDTVLCWNFNDDGELEALQQYQHLWPDPIPVERLVVYRFRSNGNNPEGESILRPAWIPYYYGSSLEEVRAIGYERHAAGMPMVRMPMGADPDESGDDYTRAAKIGRNIRVDEQGAIIIPPPLAADEFSRWEVELMSAGNAQVFTSLNSTISEYDQKVLMATLAQFIILGINKVGSQSKAETDVSFFTMAVDAFADSIASTFTNTEVNRLLRLNGRETGNIMMQHSPAGDVDSNMMIELIKAVGGKINWTPEDEIQVRSIFDLPEKTVEEIEMKKEEAEQRRREIAGQFQPADDEDMGAALFASDVTDNAPDNAPDTRDRAQMERSWYRTVERYLNGTRRRVVSGVKEM